MDRRASGKFRRQFDEGLRDEHCHRVEVASSRLETETLGLQRDRPSATEGIDDGGRTVRIALADLSTSFLEDGLVGRRLPRHKTFDDAEEPLAFRILSLGCRKAVRLRGRVVDELSEEDGSTGSEWAPRPP
jgi:hypothetical protein